MSKLLSIIVPSYNMELWLPQCVDSMTVSEQALSQLDIIIVNDGSRDATLDIARIYTEKFPDSVRVIDKSNGNYGSTINAALPLCRGEYVRILDADDCFDKSLIDSFLSALVAVSGVDMVVSPYVEVKAGVEHRVDYDIYSRHPYEFGVAYDAEKVFADGIIRFFAMHSVCYRTAMLTDMGYRQSEGISYTDQEWVFYPIFRVESIAFTDIPLYRYNLSREGQTMDSRVQLRNIGQLVQVTEAMAEYLATANMDMLSPVRKTFLRAIMLRRMMIVWRKYLLEMDDEAFVQSDFAEVDNRLLNLAERCSLVDNAASVRVPINNMLRIDLRASWRKRGQRYGSFLRALFRAADRTMMCVHGLLFR